MASSPRNCVGCAFCCSMGFGGKAHGQQCPHAVAGVGCRIHSTRPEFCASFACSWVVGIGNVRPDELGAMFAAPDRCEIHVFYTANPRDKLIEEELQACCNDMLDLYGLDVMEVHFIPLRPGGEAHARVYEYNRRGK
jgi:hypothetical protein